MSDKTCPTKKELDKILNEIEEILDIELPSAKEIIEPDDLSMRNQAGGGRVFTFEELEKLNEMNTQTLETIKNMANQLVDLFAEKGELKGTKHELEASVMDLIANIDDDKIRTENLDFIMEHIQDPKAKRALISAKAKLFQLENAERANKSGRVQEASLMIMDSADKRDLEIARIKAETEIKKYEIEMSASKERMAFEKEQMLILARAHEKHTAIINSLVIQKSRMNWMIFLIFLIIGSVMGYSGYSATDPITQLVGKFIMKVEGFNVSSFHIPAMAQATTGWKSWIPGSGMGIDKINMLIGLLNGLIDCGDGVKAIIVAGFNIIHKILQLGGLATGSLFFLSVFFVGLLVLRLYNVNKVSLGITGISLEDNTLLNLKDSEGDRLRRITLDSFYKKALPPRVVEETPMLIGEEESKKRPLEITDVRRRQRSPGEPIIEEMDDDEPQYGGRRYRLKN